MDGDLWGPGRMPHKLDVPSPSHDEGKASKRPASEGEAQDNEPPGQGESPKNQPPSEPDQEEINDIVTSEEDEGDFTIQELQTPLHQEVNGSKAESDTWRIRIHTCHLPGSGQRERRRRAHLDGKWLCLQG